MIQILRRRKVVERFVMTDVILLHGAVARHVNRIAVDEAPLEPSPGHALIIEEIADILAWIAQGRLRRAQRIADVAERARIAEDRAPTSASVGIAARDGDGRDGVARRRS